MALRNVVSSKGFFIASLTFLILILGIWNRIIAPRLTALPHDFHYDADIVSYDNLHDETHRNFLGPQRSVTQFSYTTLQEQNGDFLINNAFDVQKLTGEKIVSIQRIYGIDPITGAHVAGLGDRDREGYLFAPHHLAKGQPFTYWHINYDGPAHMVFSGEEMLGGLVVYRYETHYQGVRIDQTKNLGNLPDVGVTRGIELEPYLQVWIEPLSGRLVKYQDDTVAYFYNLKTGERENPWNHFSNTYTADSVLHQVELAKQDRLKIILVDFCVPSFFVLLFFGGVLFYFRRYTTFVFLLFGIFVVFVAGYLLVLRRAHFKSSSASVNSIRVGVSTALSTAPLWVADQNGYFRNNGLDVQIVPFSSGKAALQRMSEDHTLDFVVAGPTPFVINSFSTTTEALVAGIAYSVNDIIIVARRDHGIETAADLKGKKVGLVKGATGHYFLSLFLAQHGLTLDDITLVDINGSGLAQALIGDMVDVVVSTKSDSLILQKALTDSVIVFEDVGIFRNDSYLVGDRMWLQKNADTAQRFLKALDEAEIFIAGHRDMSIVSMSDRIHIDHSTLDSVWDGYHFQLFLDQPILLVLEQQARWAAMNQLVQASTIPNNYLDLLYFDPLEAVKSEAVTIIK